METKDVEHDELFEWRARLSASAPLRGLRRKNGFGAGTLRMVSEEVTKGSYSQYHSTGALNIQKDAATRKRSITTELLQSSRRVSLAHGDEGRGVMFCAFVVVCLVVHVASNSVCVHVRVQGCVCE